VVESADVARVSGTWAIGLLLAATLTQSSCLNECQQLCDAWYEYRELACEETDLAADLNRCLSDFQTLTTGTLEACRFYQPFVEGLVPEEKLFCGEVADNDGAFSFMLSQGEETP